MFPTPHTVTHTRRVRDGENILGQPVYTESSSTRAVHGWQPASEDERLAAALAGRTVTDLVLLTPDGDYGPDDRVTVNGRVYEVFGEVADYTHGPFGFAGGFAVKLRRVEGA